MPDFLTLTCPTCGAKLKLADNINLLVCASCGNEHMVHRGGGAIYLAPIAQDVRQIRVGTDKTAAELAVVRLTKEIAILNDEIRATRERSYTDKVRSSPLEGWLAFGMLAACGVAIYGGLLDNIWVAAAMAIAILVFAFWYASVRGKQFKEADALKQKDIDLLQAQYDAKTAALKKNHQIANS
jgi:hypothetical protein